MEPSQNTEHSGLHDIRELAKDAKQEIRRRKTTETDAREAILASTKALNLVALPDPSAPAPTQPKRVGRGTGLIHKDARLEQEAPAAAAPAAHSVDVSAGLTPSMAPSKRNGLILGLAGIAAIALIAIFAIRTMGGDGKAETAAKLAQGAAKSSETIASKSSSSETASKNDAIGSAVPLTDETTDALAGSAVSSAPSAQSSETAAQSSETAAPPAEVKTAPAKDAIASSSAPTKKEPVKKAVVASAPTPKDPVKKTVVASAPTPKDPEKTAPEKTEPTPKKDDEMDEIDSLFSDLDSDKKEEKPKAPSKQKLTASDVRKKMGSIRGSVNGCYARYEKQGTVKVRFTVQPSGQIASAKALGSFAGTDTGKCVAHHVKKAKFPAFAGRPQTFTYPFLLSP